MYGIPKLEQVESGMTDTDCRDLLNLLTQETIGSPPQFCPTT